MQQGIIQPIILSGGVGSRLWPLSEPTRPKQLLTLVGEHSLLQTTYMRFSNRGHFLPPLIVANHAHRFETAQQLEAIGGNTHAIILEPEGRNTAPAIAAACLVSKPGALLLAVPADHYIESMDCFMGAIQDAKTLCEQNYIATFGILPSRAETGYGYIEKGEPLESGHHVKCFTEKPDLDTATTYVEDGQHWWNSGMFMFQRETMLEALSQHTPEVLSHCEKAVKEAYSDADFTRLEGESFGNCPSISIDHAVMEHTKKAGVVPLPCGWSDIGSWHALVDLLKNEAEQVECPWGWYKCLLALEKRQVKELFVSPQKRMSLQRHTQRSEHWLVLEGQAEVTHEGKVHLLKEGESFFVAKGAVHRLANPAQAPLRIIEVQEGEYLGEDDIERLEDDFGRV